MEHYGSTRGMLIQQGGSYAMLRDRLEDEDTDSSANERFQRRVRRERAEADHSDDHGWSYNLGRDNAYRNYVAADEWMHARGFDKQTDYPEEIIIEPSRRGHPITTEEANRINFAMRNVASARFVDFEMPDDNPRPARRWERSNELDEYNDFCNQYVAGSAVKVPLPPRDTNDFADDVQIDERALAKKEYQQKRAAEKAANRAARRY